MKIVHFAKFYPPEFGGIESVTEALAEDHAAAGHSVEVVCFTRGLSQQDRNGRLTIRRLKARKEVASQPLAFSYLRACADAARDADVIHVHTPNMLAALAVLRLPREIQVVVHWHADIENKGALGGVVRPIVSAMLRRANVVVTTTEAYAEASAALAAFKDRVKVIPIGISDVENTPKFATKTKPYVLFVGRLVPYKGLNVLLDAVALATDSFELRIIGVGPLKSSLQAQAQRLDIADRIKFIGRVEKTELEDLIRGADIFCLPSISRLEAFGVVLLEAMRAGRAIISTNIAGSGVPWVNSTGVNVPVCDPKALAEAIDGLLADPVKTARMGKLSRDRFERYFSRKTMTDRFLRLYNDIIENNTS